MGPYEGDMKIIVAIIILAIMCVVLAYLLGVMVSAGTESVMEHSAFLRGMQAGYKKKEREINEANKNKYSNETDR